MPFNNRPRKMAPSCFEVILVGFILVLPFLYETSRTFRYYFKFLIYYGIVMVNSVLLMPAFSLRPGNVKNLVSVIASRLSDRYCYVAHSSSRLYPPIVSRRSPPSTFSPFCFPELDRRRGGNRRGRSREFIDRHSLSGWR